jgi:predicted DNA-binding transcriptional regulator YafY
MLTQLLNALREARQPLGLKELAARLEIDASTLEGMLEQLVLQGKLRKSEDLTVAECEQQHTSGLYGNLCAFLTQDNVATRYEIVEN